MNKGKNKKRTMAFFIVAAVLLIWNIIQMINPQKTLRIACVGDSITYGTGVEDREKNCYPVVLQNLLNNSKYRVGNFGVNGATLQKEGDKPYWEEERYEQSLSYDPDIVILMLGTNDSKEVNWRDPDTFRMDYEALITSYETLRTKPKIVLVTPPSIYRTDGTGQSIKAAYDSRIEEESQIIRELGEEKGVPVIDMYEITSAHPEWFNTDGIHLNTEGAAAFADAAAIEVKEIAETESNEK